MKKRPVLILASALGLAIGAAQTAKDAYDKHRHEAYPTEDEAIAKAASQHDVDTLGAYANTGSYDGRHYATLHLGFEPSSKATDSLIVAFNHASSVTVQRSAIASLGDQIKRATDPAAVARGADVIRSAVANETLMPIVRAQAMDALVSNTPGRIAAADALGTLRNVVDSTKNPLVKDTAFDAASMIMRKSFNARSRAPINVNSAAP